MSNIHLCLTGLMVEKTPDYCEGIDYPGRYVLEVYYTDGTYKAYDTEGPLAALVAVNCPGVLNYIRRQLYGNFDNVYIYIYTYTENGVTTAEFGFPQ